MQPALRVRRGSYVARVTVELAAAEFMRVFAGDIALQPDIDEQIADRASSAERDSASP
jgi:hypothetical protein